MLFSTDIDNYQQKIMNLTPLGTKCGFYQGNKLYSLGIK